MKIIPAILAENLDEFVMRMHQAEKIADYVQVDIMDGIFVDTRSFDVEMINNMRTSLSFEVHLMVQEPINVLMDIHNPSLRKAIFHAEAAGDPAGFIEKARERGLSTGLAFKPETRIDDFRDIAVRCDTLLFLTVDPGRYGSPFRPEVLRKLSRARQEFPDKKICVDGGVSLDNLKLLYDARVDCVCIGSRIFLHGDPEDNYRMFVERIRELDASK
jgi:ribulose-phosphate 3-epimerase